MEHVFSRSVRAFLTILLWLCFVAVHGFIYDDARSWPESNYFCGSCLQSPINVITENAAKVSLQPLIMNNFDKANNFTFIVNDGDSVHLQVDTLVNATVTGGNNDELFETEMVNFHWGRANDKGTEHAINFVHHALEVQIVNRNVAYPGTSLAHRGVNGYLNLAILFKEAVNDRRVPQGMKTVCSLIHAVKYHAGLSTTLPRDFTLASLFAGLNLNEYLTYCGSHTVPPCSPNVIWIVFPKPLDIDRDCLFKFRAVIANNGKNMTTTQRPLQVAGSRRVFYNTL